MKTVTELFGIKYPIISAGMVWTSGGKLAAAVSEAGGLGLIGAGSMKEELLLHHIKKAQSLTTKPIGVNVPILYKGAKDQIEVALKSGIKIFFTSAGSPKLFTNFLKDHGATVIHVTSTPELAQKCEAAGVDAVVAEGFEAGGHNGRDELTTLVLVPQVVSAVKIPVIAAGGIVDGKGIAGVMILGAKGVQMGSRFLMTQESSAHPNYKNLIKESRFDATMLTLKKDVPVRLFKNSFYNEITALENRCASLEELLAHLGKGRAKAGILEGDIENGELEIGQAVGALNDIPSVKELLPRLVFEYEEAVKSLKTAL